MVHRSPARPAPCRVSLRVGAEALPAVAVELSGHRAAVRASRALALASDVTIELAWSDGASARLPARVCATAPVSREEHLAHVEVRGVEGDWSAFLEYVGPLAVVA